MLFSRLYTFTSGNEKGGLFVEESAVYMATYVAIRCCNSTGYLPVYFGRETLKYRVRKGEKESAMTREMEL